MHVYVAPVFRQCRKTQAGIRIRMVLKQVSTQPVRKHRQYFVLPILSTFAMKNRFPNEMMQLHVSPRYVLPNDPHRLDSLDYELEAAFLGPFPA